MNLTRELIPLVSLQSLILCLTADFNPKLTISKNARRNHRRYLQDLHQDINQLYQKRICAKPADGI